MSRRPSGASPSRHRHLHVNRICNLWAVCLSVCLCVCVCVFVCMSVCLSFCLSSCLCECACVCACVRGWPSQIDFHSRVRGRSLDCAKIMVFYVFEDAPALLGPRGPRAKLLPRSMRAQKGSQTQKPKNAGEGWSRPTKGGGLGESRVPQPPGGPGIFVPANGYKSSALKSAIVDIQLPIACWNDPRNMWSDTPQSEAG